MPYNHSPEVIERLLDPTVLVAFTGGFFTLLTTIVTALGARWAKRRFDTIETHAEEAREQVKNSHQTNLRDDIDSIIRTLGCITETNKRQEEALHEIRTDLRVEREERMALSDRLDMLLAGVAGSTHRQTGGT